GASSTSDPEWEVALAAFRPHVRWTRERAALRCLRQTAAARGNRDRARIEPARRNARTGPVSFSPPLLRGVGIRANQGRDRSQLVWLRLLQRLILPRHQE